MGPARQIGGWSLDDVRSISEGEGWEGRGRTIARRRRADSDLADADKARPLVPEVIEAGHEMASEYREGRQPIADRLRRQNIGWVQQNRRGARGELPHAPICAPPKRSNLIWS